MVITASSDNQILEVAGKPPLEQLRAMVERLDPQEQARVKNGILLGIAIDPYVDQAVPGDFLVRGFQAHPPTGAFAIGDQVEVGQTVQFQVRDASSADAELRRLLSDKAPPATKGALMFLCNGRGTNMFDEPHHDAAALEATLGKIPAVGMFCQGELGPIGGQNFLHGFTASIALFGDDQDQT